LKLYSIFIDDAFVFYQACSFFPFTKAGATTLFDDKDSSKTIFRDWFLKSACFFLYKISLENPYFGFSAWEFKRRTLPQSLER